MKRNKQCPVGTSIQTLLFSKDNFTEKSAKSWAEHNDMKYGKTDIKENTIRIRQNSPFQYKKDSFRTIELTDGVKAVIGCPINSGTIKKPKFVSGGNVKFVTGDDKYKTTWGRKGTKGDSKSVGSFDIRHNGKTWDGYLFELDEFDKKHYSHLPEYFSYQQLNILQSNRAGVHQPPYFWRNQP